MPILTPGLLNQVKAISEGEMPDTFTITVPGSFVSDGQGGGSVGAGTTRGPYACRFGPASTTEEQAIADRLEQEGLQRMTYHLEDVSVSITERGTGTNTRTGETFGFEVVDVAEPSSFAVHRKALVRIL